MLKKEKKQFKVVTSGTRVENPLCVFYNFIYVWLFGSSLLLQLPFSCREQDLLSRCGAQASPVVGSRAHRLQ